MSKPKVNVFISYAHLESDFFEVFKNGLNSHLYTSGRYDFGVWEDSKILPGSFWDDEIQKNLGSSGIAILCVSSEFLRSDYIEAKEFKPLKDNYPNTLICPVYFKPCNINAWDELSKRQFFKPDGDRYGKANERDFCFCDLVKFYEKKAKPNPNIDRYLLDFVNAIENALSERYAKDTAPVRDNIQIDTFPSSGSSRQRPPEKPDVSTTETPLDKMVNMMIIGFMIMSAVIIFLNLLSSNWSQAIIFKSCLGCVMFFLSLTFFIYKNKMVNGKKLSI